MPNNKKQRVVDVELASIIEHQRNAWAKTNSEPDPRTDDEAVTDFIVWAWGRDIRKEPTDAK